MGEVYIIADDPDRQGSGIGRALLDHSCQRARTAGMRMVMVETGDDPGHEPARRSYESAGFQRRSEEHTSELQSRFDLVCRLLLEKKKEVINERSEIG